MGQEAIGRDSIGVRQEQAVEGALHRVEDDVPVFVRQEDDAPPLADDYAVPLSHDHKGQSGNRRFQTITSL